MAGLLIGEVARRAGVSPAAIRYYESIGLLASPARSATGYRRYAVGTVDELAFIRRAQTLGFSLDEIAEILTLTRSGQAACSHVLSVAHQHLAAVNERIAHLQRFRDHLASELAKWDGVEQPTCAGLCQIVLDAVPHPSAIDEPAAHRRVARHTRVPASRGTRP